MHFDQNKTVGALGTLIVAKWFRSENSTHLLVSLDSPETRRWMNLEDDSRRADFLGLSIQGNKVTIDLIESKASLDEANVYTIDRRGEISGKPVEQLINTGRSIAAIFGLNERKDHILTPPRREILRNHLYRQGFSGNRTPEEKQAWGQTLNALFAGDIKPTIRLNLVIVNLGMNQDSMDELVKAGDTQIRLVHISEKQVSAYLDGQIALKAEAYEEEVEDGERELEQDSIEEEAKEDEESTIEQFTSRNSLTSDELKEHIRQTCAKLKASCQDFGIRVTEIDPERVDIGPSVLRYKIKLAPGEDSSRLRRQAENIARQLAASSVPIIGFLPGTNYEYLDLPRPDRQTIPLEPRLKDLTIENINELPLLIGVDPSGGLCRLDLGDDRLPHMLIAGSSGSGKTIFLYSILMSLVRTHTAKSLELVIIDPKQTDFTLFESLPHLRDKVIIYDSTQGVQSVNHIADHDLQERSEILQNARCRDIKAYNLSKVKKPIRPLVVIIDEYFDLVNTLSKREKENFERVIGRLAARGRNVGIHLIVATQRPTADVITGNIKANMSCRISFSLPSSRDSQVILDESGAERLLRNGDMLLLLEGKLTRLQGFYIDQRTVERMLKE